MSEPLTDVIFVCRYCLDRDGEKVELSQTTKDEGYAEWHCPRCGELCGFRLNRGTLDLT